MAEKKSIIKKLFSKPNLACCSVEIKEDKPTESNCCGSSDNSNEGQQKEA